MVNKTHMLKENCEGKETLCGMPLLDGDFFGLKSTDMFCYVTCRNCQRLHLSDYVFTTINEGNRTTFYACDKRNNGAVGSATYVSHESYCNFITDVGVLPAHRGKGIATKLIREIMHKFPKKVQVQVKPHCLDGEKKFPLSEKDLKRFYGQLGFVSLSPQSQYMIWLPCRQVNKRMVFRRMVFRNINARATLDTLAKVQVHISGQNVVYGWGENKKEAIGDMVIRHPDYFHVTVTDSER